MACRRRAASVRLEHVDETHRRIRLDTLVERAITC